MSIFYRTTAISFRKGAASKQPLQYLLEKVLLLNVGVPTLVHVSKKEKTIKCYPALITHKIKWVKVAEGAPALGADWVKAKGLFP
ncbi:hypothetical protein CEXT_485091 [Caerostris extrusa]|uniref:Uncharacterized protein n=1 Tax=Caerostris extrusa TaxID=172846 RepID=A0AAV4Q7P3_CAEEX|nr:hypothetical protein CEXT_485091 [Caerostris extrusa]